MQARGRRLTGKWMSAVLLGVLFLGAGAGATEYGLNPDRARDGHLFDEIRKRIYVNLDGLYANCEITLSRDLEDGSGLIHGKYFEAKDRFTGTEVKFVIEFPYRNTEITQGDPYSMEVSGPSLNGTHHETGFVDIVP